MSNYKYCILVNERNATKYVMEQTSETEFTIAASEADSNVAKERRTYNMKVWTSLYNAKIRGGYEDVTSKYLSVSDEAETENDQKAPLPEDISPSIIQLLDDLKSFADNAESMDKKEVINYTPMMVLKAQEILNALISMSLDINYDDISNFLEEFNKQLFAVVSVFPRKDKKWKNMVITVRNPQKFNRKNLQAKMESILTDEQNFLNALYEEMVLYQKEWNSIYSYVASLWSSHIPKR